MCHPWAFVLEGVQKILYKIMLKKSLQLILSLVIFFLSDDFSAGCSPANDPNGLGNGNVLELEKKPSGTDDDSKKNGDDESEFALYRVPGTVISFGR